MSPALATPGQLAAARFMLKLAESSAYSKSSWDAGRAEEAKANTELEKLRRIAKIPKRKWSHQTDQAYPEIMECRRVWEEWVKAFVADRQAKLDSFGAELRDLAEAATIPTIRGPILFGPYHQVATSSYSSQGSGAYKYARAAAQRYADKAISYGLLAEVRTIPSQHYSGKDAYGQGYSGDTFGVWINTSEAGNEILYRKPEIPLREVIRLCWARGVNPRVYYPFLPHGYEESQGLDFFGREIPKAGARA